MPAYLDAAEPMLLRTSDQMTWMERAVGVGYPFATDGILAPESGGALETRTLSIWLASGLTDPKWERCVSWN